MGLRDVVRRWRRRSDPVGTGSAGAPVFTPGWRSAGADPGVVQRIPCDVTGASAFRASVASLRQHGVLTELGHHLDPGAPSGLVRGVLRPATGSPVPLSGDQPLPLVTGHDPVETTEPAAPEHSPGGQAGRPEGPAARPVRVRPRRLTPPLTVARAVAPRASRSLRAVTRPDRTAPASSASVAPERVRRRATRAEPPPELAPGGVMPPEIADPSAKESKQHGAPGMDATPPGAGPVRPTRAPAKGEGTGAPATVGRESDASGRRGLTAERPIQRLPLPGAPPEPVAPARPRTGLGEPLTRIPPSAVPLRGSDAAHGDARGTDGETPVAAREAGSPPEVHDEDFGDSGLAEHPPRTVATPEAPGAAEPVWTPVVQRSSVFGSRTGAVAVGDEGEQRTDTGQHPKPQHSGGPRRSSEDPGGPAPGTNPVVGLIADSAPVPHLTADAPEPAADQRAEPGEPPPLVGQPGALGADRGDSPKRPQAGPTPDAHTGRPRDEGPRRGTSPARSAAGPPTADDLRHSSAQSKSVVDSHVERPINAPSIARSAMTVQRHVAASSPTASGTSSTTASGTTASGTISSGTTPAGTPPSANDRLGHIAVPTAGSTARRVLPLLAARPLPVRASAHTAAPAMTRTAVGSAVVRPRWKQDQAAAAPVPDAARPRSASAPANLPSSGSPDASRGFSLPPVPHSVNRAPASTADAPSSAATPPSTGARGVRGHRPVFRAPVVQRAGESRSASAGENTRGPAPGPPRTSQPLPGVPAGVPVTVVQRDTSSPPARENQARKDGSGDATGGDPPDLDELARRLLEPMGRLLRAEIRHGRDRIGRPHDHRR